MPAVKTRRPRRTAKPLLPDAYFQSLLASNAVSAVKDESDSLVVKIVEELLKDPEVAKKIDFHTRQILKRQIGF
jgi:hypothetical protein